MLHAGLLHIHPQQHRSQCKNIAKFSSKTSSFSIAVPATRLRTRAIFRAIGSFNKRSHTVIKITKIELCQEIAYWRFVDDRTAHLPWLNECHVTLEFLEMPPTLDGGQSLTLPVNHISNGFMSFVKRKRAPVSFSHNLKCCET